MSIEKIKSNASKCKSKADKIVSLKDLNDLSKKIAERCIEICGYYSFTEKETGLRIFVEA